MKQACDDLRAYYEEAIAFQPGAKGPAEMQDWFYVQTVAGQILLAAHAVGMAHPDAAVRMTTVKVLIPRAVVNRLRSP